MDLTIVLAQVFGIIFMVAGLSMVANKKGAMAALAEMERNQGLLWMLGIIALMMGAVLVVLHNTWTAGFLSVVVTLIGWLIFVKGILILLLQDTAAPLYKKISAADSNLIIWFGTAFFIIGLLLLYGGSM